MTYQEIRDMVADALPHDNKEFIRQIRDGDQDDGPYLSMAFMVRDAIFERNAVLRTAEPVTDE